MSCADTNSSGRSYSYATPGGKEPPREKSTEYFLQLGDVIEIKFYYNQELNERVTIRPDGRISLQLVDEVLAAGLTPSELDKILTQKYSKKIKNPEIAVIVKEFGGLNVYVGGEVNSPGLIPTFGNLTAIQAIFQAKGFKNTAELKNVVIIRNQGPQPPLFMTLNLKEDLALHFNSTHISNEDLKSWNPQNDIFNKNLPTRRQFNDILLEPYDIVFVPKTTIAKINQFMSEYFDKLIPISKLAGFNWVYNLNPSDEFTVRPGE